MVKEKTDHNTECVRDIMPTQKLEMSGWKIGDIVTIHVRKSERKHRKNKGRGKRMTATIVAPKHISVVKEKKKQLDK